MPRRALAILATACLLTGLAFVAGPAVATLARGPVSTVAREVHASVAAGRSTDVELPISASHVVLHWRGNPHAQVSVAFRAADGSYGDAEPVDIDDDTADGGNGPAVAPDETFGQVLIADGATAIRVTSDRPIAQLTVVALDTLGTPLQQAADAAVAASGIGVANASVGAPTIISRAGWGANEGYRFDSGGHLKFPASYYPLQKLVVHHTAGKNNDTNPAATIRAIYYDHAILRDWGDIGYNFLIDAQGHVYEGQYSRAYAPGEQITGEDLAGNPVRGAHATNYNAGTVGIALLGNFQTVQPPAAERSALVNMLAWEASRHALDPLGASTYVNPENGTSKYLNNISGHRNVGVTACPGDAFYPTFPTLRQQVAAEIAAHKLDSDPPTARLVPLLSPTGGSTMTFGLTFNEPITDLTADDLAVSGTSKGWAVTGVTGVGASYTVTVHSDKPTDGTVIVTLAAGGVTDLAGNAGPVDPAEATATSATDTTAPTVVIYLTPHTAFLSGTFLDATVTFSEPVLGMGLGKIAIGGTSNAATPWSFGQPVIIGSGANYSLSVQAASPANGTLTLTIPDGAVTDAAGNPNTGTSVTVIIDRTAPTTSTPLTALRTGLTYNGSPAAGAVSWTGADAGGAGVASYDVARSLDGLAFAVIATGLASPALSVALAAGHTYRFEVRAHDRAGNTGAWRAGATTSTLVRQDNSGYVAYGAGWRTASSSVFSGGAVHYAATTGARASFAFTGHAIALVSSRAPTRGRAWIYLDGVYVGSIDLYSATTAYRQVVWTRTWSSSASHTIRLVVAGTGGRPQVDLDAFLVLR
ncbi:MAG TPA: N-acetylmuramoyl-L-alanine amidase [Candidatus Limnocylindrales bacterium]|nr:N-acetylmuramoyl-L-alanine amidase [Candidatus Limnocylindrales bacterium]